MMKCGQNIRILQIAPTLGVHGGIEAVAISIMDESSAFPDILMRVLFRLRKRCVATDDFKKLIESHSRHVRIFRNNPLTLLEEIMSSDIIHCHYPFLWVLIPAFLFRKKTLVTVHNKKPPGRWIVRFIEKAMLGKSNRVIFNSNFVADTWGFQSGKFLRVPAIADRESAIIPHEERRGFIVVARLIQEKGIKQLIQAYNMASIDHQRHPLTIIGSGPQMEELKQLTAESGPQHIHFLGHKCGAEKTLLIARSRWNVAPAIYREDQGMTPIEAALCDVPSIVSNTGGLAEASGPGALLVAPGDVQALRSALERAAEMGEFDYDARCVKNRGYFQDYLKAKNYYPMLYRDLFHLSCV